jgi:hypothetical protein
MRWWTWWLSVTHENTAGLAWRGGPNKVPGVGFALARQMDQFFRDGALTAAPNMIKVNGRESKA